MPLQIYEKNDTNVRILTSEGRIMGLKDSDVRLASRVMFDINNNPVSICFKNTGVGPDTNAICIPCLGNTVEYGNLTVDKLKACMQKILNERSLDLSDVKVVRSISDIIPNEEYLYIKDYGEKNVFEVYIDSFHNDLDRADVNMEDGYCEDE